MRYLLLSKPDWDAQGGVRPATPIPYPVDAVEEFVNWLRNSNAWRQNPEGLVHKCIQMTKKLEQVGPLAMDAVPSILTTDGPPALPAAVLLGCNECEFVAKSKAGLAAHQRKHTVAV